jgi:hypothetical protein
VSEPRARQLIEQAVARSSLATKNPSVNEATARRLIERALLVALL